MLKVAIRTSNKINVASRVSSVLGRLYTTTIAMFVPPIMKDEATKSFLVPNHSCR